MYIRTPDGLVLEPLRSRLGDAALCIHHAPTNGELCTFNSRKGGSTTAVYVPAAARGTDPVTLLVWIHGDLVCGNEGANAISYVSSKTFPLVKQIADSKRPFVLVVPSMKWTWGSNKVRHALGSAKGMNEFLDEVRVQLTTAGWPSAPSFGRLILAGHSRAHVVLNALAAQGVSDPTESSKRALGTLTDIWLIDTTYGKTNKTFHCNTWIKWAKAKSGIKLRIFYRKDSDTAAVAECIRDEAAIAGLSNITVQGISSHCSLPRDQMPSLLAASGKRS